MSRNELHCALLRDGGPVEGEDSAVFPWWSIGKIVLAAAVLRLADRGDIKLDDRYEDWPFTVRQLLQHTSGLKDYGGPLYQSAVDSGHPVWSEQEMLERVKARELLFVPGGGWAYSNIGYFFLRKLIERATGAELNRALAELLFEPLRIENIFVAMSPRDLLRTEWGNQSGYDPNWVYHGLLIGPASAAVRFFQGIFSDGFFSENARNEMLTKRKIGGEVAGRPWLEAGYGLGLMIGEMKDAGPAVGHTGAGPGSVSALYAFPGKGITIAAFARGADEGVVESAAAKLALQHGA